MISGSKLSKWDDARTCFQAKGGGLLKDAKPKKSAMKNRLPFLLTAAHLGAWALLCVTIATAAEGPSAGTVKFLGEFSNVRYTTEHAYGYGVQLWQEEDRLFGLFFAASGPAEDFPAGLLEDVRLNPATMELSFSAKLSAGVDYLGQGKQEPSHDFFTFRGSLHRNFLSGVLTRIDKVQPKSAPTTEQLRLKRFRNSEAIEASSYEDWKQKADKILKLRGPKW